MTVFELLQVNRARHLREIARIDDTISKAEEEILDSEVNSDFETENWLKTRGWWIEP